MKGKVNGGSDGPATLSHHTPPTSTLTARKFAKDLATTRASQGWTKHHSEICVWTRLDDTTDPDSHCYFLLHVEDSLTIGGNACKHYNQLALHCEMKDMGLPDTCCGIEFTFLPDTIILHQTAYRKYFVQHWATHPCTR